jgi:hypothetical protein
VDYVTQGGTASSGSDFSALSGTLHFPAGTRSRTVDLVVAGDAVDEPSEAFTLRLTAVRGPAVAADAVGSVTVLDGDPTADEPALRIGSIVHPEGHAGTSTAYVPVTLSKRSSQTVTARWAAKPGSASDADYTASSGSITIPAGGRTARVPVVVRGDVLDEASEGLTLTLSDVVGAAVADSSAVVRIADDDAAPRITISDHTLVEGDAGGPRLVGVTVRLSSPSTREVRVTYATSDGTATSSGASGGLDYVGRSGTLTFSPGQRHKTILVEVRPDEVPEGTEGFEIRLSSPVEARLAEGAGRVTVEDDDA